MKPFFAGLTVCQRNVTVRAQTGLSPKYSQKMDTLKLHVSHQIKDLCKYVEVK
jgi:hypothetical protein